MVQYVLRIKGFIEEDLWKVKIKRLPKYKAFLYRQIRIWVIAISEFGKDKCAEKASALTYFSLLSVVPVVAMAFGIATIFGLEKYLKDELARYFSGQEAVLDYTLQFADKMLSTSSGGVISGISAVFLIYAVARLFNSIEVAFNDVWDTKKGRSLKRMITDYMSVILLGPIILILSSSATVYITTSVENLAESFSLLGFLKPIILFAINLIPYSLIWFLLFLLYIIFPNTSVKIKSALIAGILAGTAYQLTQWGWINGQVYLSRYSVIYGSFAALPLFLIWLQLSWMIILFGAEFSFAVQNVETWAYDNEKLQMNHRTKRKMTLLVMRDIVKAFLEKERAVSFEELCVQLSIPRRFVRDIIEDLLEGKLITQVVSDDEEECFQPALDANKISIFTIYSRLDEKGLDNLPHEEENEGYDIVNDAVIALDQAIINSPSNKLVKDL